MTPATNAENKKPKTKRRLICTLCPRDPITGGLTYDRNGDVIIDERCEIHKPKEGEKDK